MALKITHRKESEVPKPGASGRVNQALVDLMNEMGKLATGMVLEIETGDEKAIRATKMLITRAANQMETPYRHWHVGTKVYAQPVHQAPKGKQRAERGNLGDNR